MNELYNDISSSDDDDDDEQETKVEAKKESNSPIKAAAEDASSAVRPTGSKQAAPSDPKDEP